MNIKNPLLTWLTPDLIKDIRIVFEPRYKKSLSDNEVFEIADNLTGVIEEILKLKWKEKYEQHI